MDGVSKIMWNQDGYPVEQELMVYTEFPAKPLNYSINLKADLEGILCLLHVIFVYYCICGVTSIQSAGFLHISTRLMKFIPQSMS